MLALLLLACTSGFFDTGFGDVCVFFEAGCDPGGLEVPDPDTCYVTCDASAPACEVGTCTEIWIDPCAGKECDACGGSAWVCM